MSYWSNVVLSLVWQNMCTFLINTDKQDWWGEQESTHRFQQFCNCLLSVQTWLMLIRFRSVLMIHTKSTMSDKHSPWNSLKTQCYFSTYLFTIFLYHILLLITILYLSKLPYPDFFFIMVMCHIWNKANF